MNGLVAFVADRDCLLHLLPGEPFFEPLVAVAGAGDKVMFGCPPLGESSAQATGFGGLIRSLGAHVLNDQSKTREAMHRLSYAAAECEVPPF